MVARGFASVCAPFWFGLSAVRRGRCRALVRRVVRQPPQVGEQLLQMDEADPLAALGVLQRCAPRAAWPITPQPQQSGVIVDLGHLVRIGWRHRLHPRAIRAIMSATTSRHSYDSSIPSPAHQTPTKLSPGLVIGVKIGSNRNDAMGARAAGSAANCYRYRFEREQN